MDEEITKNTRFSCGNCKVTYTIKYDEEETDMKPMSCPFCSYEIDEEDDIGDENEETSWD
jgi:DNA-directed RNA polymerase subunit RPC12/RpoP